MVLKMGKSGTARLTQGKTNASFVTAKKSLKVSKLSLYARPALMQLLI